MAEPARDDQASNTPQFFHPSNPFADYPTTPPPAYNFHIRDPEAGLPPLFQSQHNYPHNAPITPLKTVATNITYRSSDSSRSGSLLPPSHPRNSSTNRCYNQKRYNRRRIVCFCLAVLVVAVIPLVVLGTVFRWGRGNSFCVRWSDGSTSGDC